ncbi:MAG: hypothetical protein IRZ31_18390 [Thermogemmatispora sp.]|jgi:TRAP-type C4-dicarboxylate transport system permease small subunit|uniref:Uncharacterized protein n=2 Tax=Thermogemmatispora TaxID=768669 RepID=A0A328VIZ0_9CHLR|nr:MULTISPECIES: hypothetical protein [Thermogemmatispora]MBE3564590.1 hypothetical protein [Thermogemmatispora sp.]MBX5458867.1 hypothetical protein [Thermogemmatispora sp.]RAQ95750.1 hypothetical protein A4R35_09405 [Thermogemmatispora tikiterensis]GER82130.1 hypothetical protein KTAU_07680 [Thermogemmatispora aurantia]
MSKTILSTVLLFLVFAAFLWWGLWQLANRTSTEDVIYALMLLGCAGYALVSILLLPRKKTEDERERQSRKARHAQR